MRLLEILQPHHIIVPLSADSLRGAVIALVRRLVDSGAIARPERLDRLLSDERVRDVVHVGDRVLLPHLRTDAVDRLVVAIGVSPEPLRVRSAQGQEQIIVLVLAPPDAASRYLQVVATLARALRDDETIAQLADARSPDDILAIPQLRALAVQPVLTVRDVMGSQVFRVFPDTQVRELLDLMRRHQLKAVPVVGEKREVLGVVSDGEILRHLLPTIARAGAGDANAEKELDRLYSTQVREIMTRSVMCIPEDQALADVVTSMITKNVERLPVVRDGQLTGFLTREDVMRKLFAS